MALDCFMRGASLFARDVSSAAQGMAKVLGAAMPGSVRWVLATERFYFRTVAWFPSIGPGVGSVGHNEGLTNPGDKEVRDLRVSCGSEMGSRAKGLALEENEGRKWHQSWAASPSTGKIRQIVLDDLMSDKDDIPPSDFFQFVQVAVGAVQKISWSPVYVLGKIWAAISSVVGRLGDGLEIAKVRDFRKPSVVEGGFDPAVPENGDDMNRPDLAPWQKLRSAREKMKQVYQTH